MTKAKTNSLLDFERDYYVCPARSGAPNKYEIQVYVGNDPITGKKITKAKTVTCTAATKKALKAELDAAAAKIKAEWNADDPLVLAKRISLEEYYVKHFPFGSGMLGKGQTQLDDIATTFKGYIPKWLKIMKLADIAPVHISRCIQEIMKQKNKKNGNDLSYRTVTKHANNLSSILAGAVSDGFLILNPCHGVKKPGKKDLPSPKPTRHGEEKVLQYDEQQVRCFLWTIFSGAEYEPISKEHTRTNKNGTTYTVKAYSQGKRHHKEWVYYYFRLAAQLGARRGELVGLKWSDFTVDRRKTYAILIQRVVTRKGINSYTKNGTVRRVIISEDLFEDFDIWHGVQCSQRGEERIELKDDDRYVFARESDPEMPMGLDTPTQAVDRLITTYNNWFDRTFQSEDEAVQYGYVRLPLIDLNHFRHSNINILDRAQVRPVVSAAMTGHSVTTELSHYQNANINEQKQAAEIIERSIGSFTGHGQVTLPNGKTIISLA